MQFNRALATTIRAGAYIILFTPLVVFGNMFFPFITGKNFIFRIIVEVIFALWFILALRDKTYLPKRNFILYFAAAAIASLVLGTIFSIDASRSFWSNFERMEGLLGHLHVFIYFLVLFSVNRNEKEWHRFFHISFIASLLVGGYALLQLSGAKEIHQGGTRIDATLGNATYFAVYMLFHVFLALYYFLKKRDWVWKTLYSILFLFESFLIFQTATRGAVLGLFGGLFLFALIYSFTAENRRIRNYAIGSLAAMIVLAAGFYLAKDSKFVKQSTTLSRVSSISINDDDAKARFYIWGMAIESIKERPIFGWGPENFAVVFSKYFDPRLWAREPWFDRAHNVFLDWMVQGGIIGLVSYLGIFASSVWLLFKKYFEKKITNIELSVLVGLLAGFFFQNIFVFDQLASYILIYAVFAFIAFLVTKDISYREMSKVSEGAQYVWASAIILALLVSLYVFNVKPILANTSLLSALNSANSGRFQEAQDLFKRAINLSPLGRREAREQYAHYSTLLARAEGVPDALKKSTLEDAAKEAKLQTEDSPLDSRAQLFLGSVYEAQGKSADAFAAYKKALELSPRKQQIAFLVAQYYINQNNLDEAVRVAKEAAYADYRYGDAVRNLISLQVYAGKFDEAKKEIEKFAGEKRVNMDDFKNWGSIAAQRGNFNFAVENYRAGIELMPSDTQLRVNLAAALVELNKRSEAIEELRNAIAADPSFKEQGDAFIKEIQAGKKP